MHHIDCSSYSCMVGPFARVKWLYPDQGFWLGPDSVSVFATALRTVLSSTAWQELSSTHVKGPRTILQHTQVYTIYSNLVGTPTQKRRRSWYRCRSGTAGAALSARTGASDEVLTARPLVEQGLAHYGAVP